MVLKTNRWSPDTCSCIVEFTWDDSIPQDSRVHNISNVVQRCPAHSNLDTNTHWNVLMEENPRKNIAIQNIIDRFPVQLSSTGLVGGSLKDGINIDFSLSGIIPNRVLSIDVTGITLTAIQKTNVQNTLDTRFGIGKVILM